MVSQYDNSRLEALNPLRQWRHNVGTQPVNANGSQLANS